MMIFKDFFKITLKRPQDPRDLSIPFGKDRISFPYPFLLTTTARHRASPRCKSAGCKTARRWDPKKSATMGPRHATMGPRHARPTPPRGWYTHFVRINKH